MAPEVPGATRRKVDTIHVRRPQALPISLEIVSLQLLQLAERVA